MRGGSQVNPSYPPQEEQEEQEEQIRHFINYLEKSVGLGSLKEYEIAEKSYNIDDTLIIADVMDIIKSINLEGRNKLTENYPRLTEYLRQIQKKESGSINEQ